MFSCSDTDINSLKSQCSEDHGRFKCENTMIPWHDHPRGKPGRDSLRFTVIDVCTIEGKGIIRVKGRFF